MIKYLFLLWVSLAALSSYSQEIRLFDTKITIPAKYKLVNLKSLDTSKIQYATGNFSSPPENGKLESITIGLVSSYLQENNASKFSDLGEIKSKNDELFELVVPKINSSEMADEYHYKLFFNDKYFISYFTTDLADIAF